MTQLSRYANFNKCFNAHRIHEDTSTKQYKCGHRCTPESTLTSTPVRRGEGGHRGSAATLHLQYHRRRIRRQWQTNSMASPLKSNCSDQTTEEVSNMGNVITAASNKNRNCTTFDPNDYQQVTSLLLLVVGQRHFTSFTNFDQSEKLLRQRVSPELLLFLQFWLVFKF